jgi:hypothetical protein
MIDDPELIKALKEKAVANYATEKAQAVLAETQKLLDPWFPPTYDNPFGGVPSVVNTSLGTIHDAVYDAAVKDAEHRLVQSVKNGMETILNA